MRYDHTLLTASKRLFFTTADSATAKIITSRLPCTRFLPPCIEGCWIWHLFYQQDIHGSTTLNGDFFRHLVVGHSTCPAGSGFGKNIIWFWKKHNDEARGMPVYEITLRCSITMTEYFGSMKGCTRCRLLGLELAVSGGGDTEMKRSQCYKATSDKSNCPVNRLLLRIFPRPILRLSDRFAISHSVFVEISGFSSNYSRAAKILIKQHSYWSDLMGA